MAESYDRAKRLFLEICDLDPKAQAEVLDRECAGDSELRSEVESLLDNHHGPTLTTPPPIKQSGPKEELPQNIGVYRVISQLGAGGMGSVYLGLQEDSRFKRYAAVKVLRRGMDTRDILGRFKLERQILGAMNHPNIARLYEGGETGDGLPYFAMEYVDGQPLDRFCDTRRLRITERLELFRKVCAAVHYAHQNLVVHRDLKPRNIVVTKEGEPKLLDFGISKIINPGLVFAADGRTASDQRAMTPEYASPEQVRGDPITTASDIYSLGVLLYELVCGHRPYHLRTPQDLTRYICDEDPDKPSTAVSRVEEFEVFNPQSGFTTTRVSPEGVAKVRESRPERLRRRLAGDIDNIVLMAMRKEPQRRYQSAEQMGEDIRRHLVGLPVIARRDTLGYRSRKFVRRHRLGVGAAAAIAIVLAAGIVSTASALQSERHQRQRADERFTQVQSLAHIFMFDFHDKIQQLDGSLGARELLVTTALDYLGGLAAEAGDDPGIRRDLASGYDRVGDIRGGIRGGSLGDTRGALQNYRAGLELREKLLSERPDDLVLRMELSTSYMHVGDMLKRRGDVNDALGAYRKALELREQLAEADAVYRRQLDMGLNNVGVALVDVGRLGEAKGRFDASLTIRRRLAAETPDDQRKRRDVSVQLIDLGELLESMGDLDGALRQYLDALDIRKRLLQQDADNGTYKRDVGNANYVVGGAFLLLGRLDVAAGYIQECSILFEQRDRDNSTEARARSDLGLAHELSGRLKAETGDASGAFESYRIFQSIMLELAERDPGNGNYKCRVADSYERLAEMRSESDSAAALQAYGEALDIVVARATIDPNDVRLQESQSRILLAMGQTLYSSGDSQGARTRLELARTKYEELRLKQPEHAGIRRGLASTLHQLSTIAAAGGRSGDAQALTAQALELISGPTQDPRTNALRRTIEEGQ